MNAPSTTESTALAAVAPPNLAVTEFDAATLILGPTWERIQAFGKMMARGAATIPRHLQGNEADCTAIALQAFGWRMNPYAVAQKTHISQSGALGYEAQLVNAVIQASGALDHDPDYEYIGDWSRVLGKVEEKRSDKGGKYYVATYTKQDEEGLGVIVRATLRGEKKPRELTVMMSQAWPRFSTQWATDPRQQIAYLALRKFVRLHKPGVVLGVNTNEELAEVPAERFMGPADEVQPPAPPAPAATYPDDQFKANLPKWRDVIAKGRKTADQIIAIASSKHPLTEEQKAEIRKDEAQPAAAAPAADQPTDVQPKTSYAAVAEAMNKATTRDELDAAATLIAAVAEAQRDELGRLYDQRCEELA